MENVKNLKPDEIKIKAEKLADERYPILADEWKRARELAVKLIMSEYNLGEKLTTDELGELAAYDRKMSLVRD